MGLNDNGGGMAGAVGGQLIWYCTIIVSLHVIKNTQSHLEFILFILKSVCPIVQTDPTLWFAESFRQGNLSF
jgi:hypothetical protein